LALLHRIVSPQWPHAITPVQRAEAYKYLGAAVVLLGRQDSAVALFRTALEHYPFTDVDPEAFTPAQVGAFALARQQTFAVAIRPVTGARVDPRTDRVRFPFVTTHTAALQAELRQSDSAFTILESVAAGVGEVVWDGLGPDGRLAPPGRYELRITATSRILPRRDSARAYFDLAYDHSPLEDTLPPIPPESLLPERQPGRVALGEIGKGLAVGGGVFVISAVLANGDLGRDEGIRPAIVAGGASLAGVIAFLERRRSRDLPQNIAANHRRREERSQANAAIRARNAARLAGAVLVVTPAAGVGP
jgi:hypothetical protein